MVTYTGDPGNLHTYYSLLKDKENHTGLELAAELDDDTKGIKATTTLYTSRDMEGVQPASGVCIAGEQCTLRRQGI